MAEDDYIDAELVDDKAEGGREVVHHQGDGAVTEHPGRAAFSPMSADPQALARSMQTHQENERALREWLLANLEPGRDYGAIHVVKNCDNKHNCTNPYHYSEDRLYDSGAQRVRTILGLGARYPGMKAYREAPLKGIKILDVIATCEIVDGHGNVIGEMTGAANVAKHEGDLHNTITKAQKRARVNAVNELPTVRALFKGSKTLPNGTQHGSTSSPNAADLRQSTRTRRPEPEQPGQRPAAYTGSVPTELPFKIGNAAKGMPISQLDGKLLTWMLEKLDRRPDLQQAARQELDRRRLQEPEPPAADEDVDKAFYDDPLPDLGGGTQAPPADVSRPRRRSEPSSPGGSLFDEGFGATDY